MAIDEDGKTTTVGVDEEQQLDQDSRRSSLSSSDTSPSSSLQQAGAAISLQPVEVVETTEDGSMIVTVRGHVQDNLLDALSSLVAPHTVKDMRKQGDDLILVLSIDPDNNTHANSSSSIPDLERQLQAALEEASYRQQQHRMMEQSVARMPDNANSEWGESTCSRMSLLVEPAAGGVPMKSCKALGLDCQDDDGGGLMPPPGIIMDAMFAEITPQDSEKSLMAPQDVASANRRDDLTKGPRPGAPRQPSTPGAFYVSGSAMGAVPEWAERSQAERSQRREDSPTDTTAPMVDTTENTVTAFKVDEKVQEENVRQRIIGEAVEADVVDETEALRKRRKRLCFFISFTVILSAIAIGLGVALSRKEETIVRLTEAPTMSPSGRPTEVPRPTLEKVLDRGTLRCGTADNVPGLSAFNGETNSIEGFNVDLCRAIATAALGDSSRVEIVPVDSADRFEALLYGSVDVLVRRDTHTLDREVVEGTTGAGFWFSAPFLYSGLVFAGEPDFVDCAEALDSFFHTCRQLKICVNEGTSLEAVVDELFPASFVLKTESALDSFVNGECNTAASEPVASHEGVFRAAGYTGEFKSGTEIFSNEPLAMVTRRDDPEWADMVNSVLHALWAAEAQNLTQASAANFTMESTVGNFTQSMYSDVIAAVGNYDEMFSRHLDGIVPRSGLNTLNRLGTTGLLYVLPFGALERSGPGPIQGGTLQTILDRGYLRCGVSSDIVGFAEFNAASLEWSGLDVSFCRVIAVALFAVDTEETMKFVNLTIDDRYVALASDEVDVLAGGMSSLVNEILEPTSMTGFSFSSPYFYGSPDGDVSDHSTRSLVTRQDDSQWSTFVYWCLIATVFAEEQAIEQRISNKMPVVNLFGDRFVQMFRDIVALDGNYGEIYDGALEATIPRAGRNLLNTVPHGPQQFPYTLFP